LEHNLVDILKSCTWRITDIFVALFLMVSLFSISNASSLETDAHSTVYMEFLVDTDLSGSVMNVQFMGNASRLDSLLMLRSVNLKSRQIDQDNVLPSSSYFPEHYPYYSRFRIGNIFVGYKCNGMEFDELVSRDKGGNLVYHFEQTLDMLQTIVEAGIKPHIALTGTPFELVPSEEKLMKHKTYGCVNAPRIDFTKSQPKDRMPEWWGLQDAFFSALIKRQKRNSKLDLCYLDRTYESNAKTCTFSVASRCCQQRTS
jgi:hypothetical protein